MVEVSGRNVRMKCGMVGCRRGTSTVEELEILIYSVCEEIEI